jgi:putative FmdB family regulatory protein
MKWLVEPNSLPSSGVNRMPLYEYSCSKCQSEFELLIRSDETPQCPGCGGGDLERLLSVPAAHTASSSQLPVCGAPAPGACGLAQCGGGGCPLD